MTNNKRIAVACLMLFVTSMAQTVKIVTNHTGYETGEAKRAVIVTEHKDIINTFCLINKGGTIVFTDKPVKLAAERAIAAARNLALAGNSMTAVKSRIGAFYEERILKDLW